MSDLALSIGAALEIKALAATSLAKLAPASAGHAFARRGVARPIDYMRYAEFEAMLRDLDMYPELSLLDVSSPQWFTILLAHRFPRCTFHYTNIIDSELDPFREIGRALSLENLVYEKADVRKLAYGDASFDRVISISVLEHVYPEVGGDVAAMQEIRRVLKPGGRLVLTVPFKSVRNIVFKDDEVYERRERTRNFFAREYDAAMFQELVVTSGMTPSEAWLICERSGMFALDYYEWGPGKDNPAGKVANRIRRLAERAMGRSFDQTLAARYLDVSRAQTGRLVNIAVALSRQP